LTSDRILPCPAGERNFFKIFFCICPKSIDTGSGAHQNSASKTTAVKKRTCLKVFLAKRFQGMFWKFFYSMPQKSF
jgi:hypothetical protein